MPITGGEVKDLARVLFVLETNYGESLMFAIQSALQAGFTYDSTEIDTLLELHHESLDRQHEYLEVLLQCKLQ